MSEYVCAIDFGSSKIALALGEKRGDGLHVAYYDSMEVNGIRNGEIQNESQVGRILRPMIEKAETETGLKIEEAVTNLSGRGILKEDVSVSDQSEKDRIITADDITELTNSIYSRNTGGKVFEVCPQKYQVDDCHGLHEHEIDGMNGKYIEGLFKVFYGKESLLSRRRQVLANCNIRMSRCILSPIASARAVLTTQEMDNGAAVVDIGKGMTEIAIVQENVVRDMYFIPFGGESITTDIRNITNLGAKRAEEIKVRYGYCLEEMAPENKTLELIDENGGTETTIQLKLLTGIVEARISEILDAVRYVLDNSPYSSKLPGGVVITGGSAYLSYILPLAKALLERKCRLDAPRVCITGDSNQKALDAYSSTCVGMLLEYFDRKLSTGGRISEKKQPQPANGSFAGDIFGKPDDNLPEEDADTDTRSKDVREKGTKEGRTGKKGDDNKSDKGFMNKIQNILAEFFGDNGNKSKA